MGSILSLVCPRKAKKYQPGTETTPNHKISLPFSEYTFSKLHSQGVYKAAPCLFGYPIIIEECTRTTLCILDVSSQITIDGCQDCLFVLGPCQGSIFIRDCQNCVFILAVQQFRTRNVQHSEFLLFSQTEPIIEQSLDLTFYPYSLEYKGLKGKYLVHGMMSLEQLESLSFDENRNLFDQIHDFNPRSTSNFKVCKEVPRHLLDKPMDKIFSDPSFEIFKRNVNLFII